MWNPRFGINIRCSIGRVECWRFASDTAAFARGTLTVLSPKNHKVFAYLRQDDGDTLLCVANLAASAQAVELDLSQFVGRVPVELHAGGLFPPIGELTYLLTLPPYGFYWFALTTTADPPAWHSPAPEPLPEFVTLVIRQALAKEVSGLASKLMEQDVLPQYVAMRRWFDLKNQDVEEVRLTNAVDIGDAKGESVLTAVEIKTPAETSHWLLPLGITWEDEQPSLPLANRLAMARIRRHRRVGLLTDAFALPNFVSQVITGIAELKRNSIRRGCCSLPTDRRWKRAAQGDGRPRRYSMDCRGTFQQLLDDSGQCRS